MSCYGIKDIYTYVPQLNETEISEKKDTKRKQNKNNNKKK